MRMIHDVKRDPAPQYNAAVVAVEKAAKDPEAWMKGTDQDVLKAIAAEKLAIITKNVGKALAEWEAAAKRAIAAK